MVQFFSSCVPPNAKPFSRYIRYAKRQLGIKPSTEVPPIIRDISHNEALHHRDFPITTTIVLGNSCNLRCGHCGFHSPSAPSYFSRPEEMSWNIVDNLAMELPLHHGAQVKFGAFEEPLLYYPKFEALVSRLIRRGIEVQLTTNGTLIRSDRMELRRNLSRLYISLDAATSSTYKRIRGDDYNRVVSNVLDLAQRFNGDKIGVSFIRQPSALGEEQAFVDYWIQKVDMVILYALDVFNKSGYIIDKPFLEPPSNRVVCSSPWLETYVMPDGSVSLCCQTIMLNGREDIPIMGNLKEQSLSEIWNGPKYERYRAALIDEDWDIARICESCSLWSAAYHTIEYQNGFKISRNPTTKVIEAKPCPS
jgi:MoaA/NifB/PqqE/SkfB family radical SAM enzyme